MFEPKLTTIAELKVGDEIWRTWGRGRGDLCHVRGFVDDRVIIREWLPSKERWRYEVLDRYSFSTGLYNKHCAECGLPGCSHKVSR